jgi:hypothetical protein
MVFKCMVFIIFFVYSCQKKDNVEIYLLKEVKPNKIGVKYLNDDKYDTTTYDSIKNIYYKWGDFDYEKVDLNEKPFISNSEILSLDTLKGVIKFNRNASQRIIKITSDFHRSKQFVITVNGKPVMNGYFHNIFSSFGTDWNTIRFEDLKNIENKELKFYQFNIYKGKGLKNNFDKAKINYSEYPTLIDALVKSGRLEVK